MAQTVCDVCGRSFEGKRRDAVHCSPACARAAYAIRNLPALKAALEYLEREIRRL
jgi:hypothetical protein